MVVHAKKAYVEKNKGRGELILISEGRSRIWVCEYGARRRTAQFVSFDRWKEPIVFKLTRRINRRSQKNGLQRISFVD